MSVRERRIMFCKITSCGLRGVEGYPVSVETDIRDGLPSMNLIGNLSKEVWEAQDRVKTALKNSGFRLPPKKITVNLSPADVRKEGTGYDLAIACAVLCCLGEMDEAALQSDILIGELGLGGEVKPVSGVLPRVYAAAEAGMKRFFLPQDNLLEGTAVQGIEIVGIESLSQLVRMMERPDAIRGSFFDGSMFQTAEQESGEGMPDFSELSGQTAVKRACQVSAAGRHNILYLGPAGTGKTMAAKRLSTILPPITLKESIEVSKIYSICGLLEKDRPLITKRPYRSPHHSITAQALVGGGRTPKPGEISLSCHGVLFLDELAEFSPKLLDLLRQPMEDRAVTVARLNGSVRFPADTVIAAAMNPCKCGHYPDRNRCTCTQTQIRSYLGRISGPFLDRFDIGVEVPLLPYEELRSQRSKETSRSMRARVQEAQERQSERFLGRKLHFNSRMGKKEIEEFCGLSRKDEDFLKKIYKTYGFSARAYEKILRTARTAADLDGARGIQREHLSEAVFYRCFEKKYWGFKA